jgi:hypothetical protein
MFVHSHYIENPPIDLEAMIWCATCHHHSDLAMPIVVAPIWCVSHRRRSIPMSDPHFPHLVHTPLMSNKVSVGG